MHQAMLQHIQALADRTLHLMELRDVLWNRNTEHSCPAMAFEELMLMQQPLQRLLTIMATPHLVTLAEHTQATFQDRVLRMDMPISRDKGRSKMTRQNRASLQDLILLGQELHR